jgi:hypothetical protein
VLEGTRRGRVQDRPSLPWLFAADHPTNTPEALSAHTLYLHERMFELSERVKEVERSQKSSKRWLIGLMVSITLGLSGIIVILILKLIESST